MLPDISFRLNVEFHVPAGHGVFTELHIGKLALYSVDSLLMEVPTPSISFAPILSA
jgi:hypothetical protein